ncbi:MAG: serine/threonine-protein kinase [Cyanobacteria bacterium J06621_11]
MVKTLLNDRYKILETLGQGGFGTTHVVMDTHLPSRPSLVLKELNPVAKGDKARKLVQQRFEREAVVLEKLGKSHSQIPSLYAFFLEAGKFYLIQEWIEGQTLTQKLKSEGVLSETSVRQLLVEILDVLSYVHEQGIIHRDIKPDNIIIRKNDNKPVLIDFGAVKEVMGIHLNTHGSVNSSIRIGTPGFISPEQAIGRPVHSSDLYSLGLTAIYLLSGKLPQDFPTNSETGDIDWQPHCPMLSPWFSTVLDKVIQNYPPNRYMSANEMKNALQSKTTSISSLTSFSKTERSNGIPTIQQADTKVQSSQVSPNTSKRWLFPGVVFAGILCLLGSLFLGLRVQSLSEVSQPPSDHTLLDPDVGSDVDTQTVSLEPDGEEAAKKAEEEAAARQAQEEAAKKAEEEAAARQAQEEAAARRAQEAAARQAQEEAAARRAQETAARQAQEAAARQAAERAETRSRYCIVTINNSLVSLMSEPDNFSQEITGVSPDDYYVLNSTTTTFVNRAQRWLQIEVGGRQGWIRDDTWTIAAKSSPCQ